MWMVEASQDFRLLSVTTDHPLELHDSGPNQVINQMVRTELKF
jgi:2-succinyl-5-enolpyruvyl-6-hydroxy-3-cyclohexene-1-carboxylate synthase